MLGTWELFALTGPLKTFLQSKKKKKKKLGWKVDYLNGK